MDTIVVVVVTPKVDVEFRLVLREWGWWKVVSGAKRMRDTTEKAWITLIIMI